MRKILFLSDLCYPPRQSKQQQVSGATTRKTIKHLLLFEMYQIHITMIAK